jgi:hypothetical protein
MEVSGQLHVPNALLPDETAPGTHWTGGWMNPRADLEAVEESLLPLQENLVDLWRIFSGIYIKLRYELVLHQKLQGA